jgi:hypothetical protein
MPVLTLLVKARHSGQLRLVEELLRTELGDLDLDLKVLGAPVNKWVQVSLDGEDEVIATNYINKEIGTCPVSIKKVEENEVLKGYISKVDAIEGSLVVDIGIFEPKTIQAVIPLGSLQTQLEKICLWKESLLDRLIVLGVPLALIEKAIERTKLERDVIETQRLGFFEYALTCKLGTDATGLVPRLGRYLRNAVFVVFNSKRTLFSIGE